MDVELAMVGLRNMGSVVAFLGTESVPDIDSVLDIRAVGLPDFDIFDNVPLDRDHGGDGVTLRPLFTSSSEIPMADNGRLLPLIFDAWYER